MGLAKTLYTPVSKFLPCWNFKTNVHKWIQKKNWRAVFFNAKWGNFFHFFSVQKINYFFIILLLKIVLIFFTFCKPLSYWRAAKIPQFALFCISRKTIKNKYFFKGWKTPYFSGVIGCTLYFKNKTIVFYLYILKEK